MFFDHAELDKSVSERLRQQPTTENNNIAVFGANLATVGCASLSQSLGDNFIVLDMVEKL